LKAGDVVGLSSNIIIKVATLDNCTHVAIAINESEVVEILTSGLRRVSLEKCVEGCSGAFLYERPDNLPKLEAEVLESEYKRLKADEVKYSFPRMLYSGYLPISRNFFYGAALVWLVLMYFLGAINYMPLAAMFLLYPLTLYLLPHLRPKIKALERFRCLKWFVKDFSGEFCSSLVVYLDSKAGGTISTQIKRSHEPRPNDVVRACKALDYKVVSLKSARLAGSVTRIEDCS